MSQETQDHLHGISCEVEHCIYNDGCQHCTAEDICVKNRMALMGEETMCSTFEEK